MSVEAIAIVLNHSKAKGSAKVILIGIANHLNPDNDGAWPSQAKLANYANITDRAVRTAIDELVKLGELRYEVGTGRSYNQYKPNRYWLTLSCPPECDGSANHKIREEVSNNRVEVFDSQGGSFLQSGWKQTSYEPLIEPKEEPLINLSPQNKFEGRSVQDLFDEWYSHYPRKTGKQDAYRQFVKALKLVGFEKLLAGVIRFANDPNQHPKVLSSKIKHPATWLSKGCWDDEPLPVANYTREESLLIQAERNKRVRDTSREATQELLVEMEERKRKATPPPQCKHGKSVITCRECLFENR
jgi:hypothetical protein